MQAAEMSFLLDGRVWSLSHLLFCLLAELALCVCLAVAPGDVANFNLFTWWASSYSEIFCRLQLEDY